MLKFWCIAFGMWYMDVISGTNMTLAASAANCHPSITPHPTPFHLYPHHHLAAATMTLQVWTGQWNRGVGFSCSVSHLEATQQLLHTHTLQQQWCTLSCTAFHATVALVRCSILLQVMTLKPGAWLGRT